MGKNDFKRGCDTALHWAREERRFIRAVGNTVAVFIAVALGMLFIHALRGCIPKRIPYATAQGQVYGIIDEPGVHEEYAIKHELAGPPAPPPHAYPQYPDTSLTPGVVLPVSEEDVCAPSYGKSLGHVRADVRAKVLEDYNVTLVGHSHQVDHFVSLELGGSHTAKNLWAQPYDLQYGAHQKDLAECHLHDMVCAGKMTLKEAQRLIQEDWVKVYQDCCEKK